MFLALRRAIVTHDPHRAVGSTRRDRVSIGRLARCVLLAALASVVVVSEAQPAGAAGSRNLFPATATGSRANLEWRTSTYGGGLLKRRTLIQVFANAGEQILMGSTAVGVGEADILVFDPGTITGPIGEEVIPANADFSCEAQRPDTTTTNIGRIRNRDRRVGRPASVRRRVRTVPLHGADDRDLRRHHDRPERAPRGRQR